MVQEQINLPSKQEVEALKAAFDSAVALAKKHLKDFTAEGKTEIEKAIIAADKVVKGEEENQQPQEEDGPQGDQQERGEQEPTQDQHEGDQPQDPQRPSEEEQALEQERERIERLQAMLQEDMEEQEKLEQFLGRVNREDIILAKTDQQFEADELKFEQIMENLREIFDDLDETKKTLKDHFSLNSDEEIRARFRILEVVRKTGKFDEDQAREHRHILQYLHFMGEVDALKKSAKKQLDETMLGDLKATRNIDRRRRLDVRHFVDEQRREDEHFEREQRIIEELEALHGEKLGEDEELSDLLVEINRLREEQAQRLKVKEDEEGVVGQAIPVIRKRLETQEQAEQRIPELARDIEQMATSEDFRRNAQTIVEAVRRFRDDLKHSDEGVIRAVRRIHEDRENIVDSAKQMRSTLGKIYDKIRGLFGRS